MNKLRKMIGATLVLVVLISMSFFALSELAGRGNSGAKGPAWDETLAADFLLADGPRDVRDQVNMTRGDEESIRLLNDWTFTRRTRFSRFH